MEKDKNWKPDYKNDVVYLHVLPRSYAGSTANISPFALKVETWLRINNIPFQVIDILCFIDISSHSTNDVKLYHNDILYEPRHEISNNVVSATSKGSDQPAHTHRLVSAFASRLNTQLLADHRRPQHRGIIV